MNDNSKTFDAPIFLHQFHVYESVPLEISHPALFEPFEGFTGEHVPSISELIRRVQSGQFVETFEDGQFIDDQVFDTEIPERFDYLDTVEQMRQSSGAFASSSAKQSPSQEGDIADHNSDIAPSDDPSVKSDGDNVGN